MVRPCGSFNGSFHCFHGNFHHFDGSVRHFHHGSFHSFHRRCALLPWKLLPWKLPREVSSTSTKAVAIPVEVTFLEEPGCFHGSSIHRFHGSSRSLLASKLVGASIETMEASMEVVEAPMEVVEASVVVNVPRPPWKPREASTTSMEVCGSFRRLWKLLKRVEASMEASASFMEVCGSSHYFHGSL